METLVNSIYDPQWKNIGGDFQRNLEEALKRHAINHYESMRAEAHGRGVVVVPLALTENITVMHISTYRSIAQSLDENIRVHVIWQELWASMKNSNESIDRRLRIHQSVLKRIIDDRGASTEKLHMDLEGVLYRKLCRDDRKMDMMRRFMLHIFPKLTQEEKIERRRDQQMWFSCLTTLLFFVDEQYPDWNCCLLTTERHSVLNAEISKELEGYEKSERVKLNYHLDKIIYTPIWQRVKWGDTGPQPYYIEELAGDNDPAKWNELTVDDILYIGHGLGCLEDILPLVKISRGNARKILRESSNDFKDDLQGNYFSKEISENFLGEVRQGGIRLLRILLYMQEEEKISAGDWFYYREVEKTIEKEPCNRNGEPLSTTGLHRAGGRPGRVGIIDAFLQLKKAGIVIEEEIDAEASRKRQKEHVEESDENDGVNKGGRKMEVGGELDKALKKKWKLKGDISISIR